MALMGLVPVLGLVLAVDLVAQDPAGLAEQVRNLRPGDRRRAEQVIRRFRSLPRAAREKALRRLTRSDLPYWELLRGRALYDLAGYPERRRPHVQLIRRSLLQAPDDATRADMAFRLTWLREPLLQRVVRDWVVPGVDPKLLRHALVYLHSAEDAPVRRKILKLLADPGLRSGSRLLCQAFLVLAGDGARVEALARLVEAGGLNRSDFFRFQEWLMGAPTLPKRLLDALCTLLGKTGDRGVQLELLRVFSRFNHPAAFRTVRNFLEHPDYGVAKQAFLTVASYPGDTSLVPLRRMLAHKRADRRLIAADILRRLDDVSGYDVALAIYRQGGKDGNKALNVVGLFRLRRLIPVLIDGLLAPDRRRRYLCWFFLEARLRDLFPYRRLDLKATGYRVDGTRERQEKAVRLILAWWRKYGGEQEDRR